MGFFAFFGSLMIGGIIGVLFERWGITRNGILPSVIIALGAVITLTLSLRRAARFFSRRAGSPSAPRTSSPR